jgi:hypothetical protein
MPPAMNSDSKFGAGSSALGYLFQIEYAFLETLRRLRREPALRVRLEVLDDVQFEAGDALEVLQTKHRGAGSLSDRSSDLWKTLRVWAEQFADILSWGSTATLGLVTTAAAPEGSAASFLRADGERNLDEALRILNGVVAEEDRAQTNEAAYRAWEDLDAHGQRALLDRVVVFDSAPTIADLRAELDAELMHIGRLAQRRAVLERLHGVWVDLAVEHLLDGGPKYIAAAEVQERLYDFVDQLRDEGLIIDPPPTESDEQLAELYRQERFVAQLDLIAAGRGRLANALRNYHRAYAQRSRWEREELLNVGELDRYEQELVDEWRQLYGPVLDDLPAEASEDDKRRAGRGLLDLVEQQVRVSLRPRCDAAFIVRGSMHMLADDLRVGWHPEFRQRLEHLLLTGGGVSA